MQNLGKYSSSPLKLVSCRAERTYRGGKLLEEWLGSDRSDDSYYPEDWIASTVTSLHPGKKEEREGHSKVLLPDGGEAYLSDIIETAPAEYLGDSVFRKFGPNIPVLIKVLDSAERLIIQVHPDSERAMRFFGSTKGKTECWYILGCRPVSGEDAYVLAGFKEGITKEKWKDLIQRQDKEALVNCLNKIKVEAGQVFLIKGGTPHAIGSGCFILEIQEPTDYTMRVERTSPSGLVLGDYSMHMNLGLENMLEIFDYKGFTEQEARKNFMVEPKILKQTSGFTSIQLVGYENTPYFSMKLLLINEETPIRFEKNFSVFVIAKGHGTIKTDERSMDIREGEKIFLPAGLTSAILKSGSEPLRIIWCFPPESE